MVNESKSRLRAELLIIYHLNLYNKILVDLYTIILILRLLLKVGEEEFTPTDISKIDYKGFAAYICLLLISPIVSAFLVKFNYFSNKELKKAVHSLSADKLKKMIEQYKNIGTRHQEMISAKIAEISSQIGNSQYPDLTKFSVLSYKISSCSNRLLAALSIAKLNEARVNIKARKKLTVMDVIHYKQNNANIKV